MLVVSAFLAGLFDSAREKFMFSKHNNTHYRTVLRHITTLGGNWPLEMQLVSQPVM